MAATWHNRWKGETVACIATGASLNLRDCDAIRKSGARVIAVNDAFRLAMFADVVYAADHQWWHKYHKDVLTIASEMWSHDESACKDFNLRFVQSLREHGLGKEAGFIHHGTNSGYQALNLAYQFGASKIILLGYDCQYTDGKRHFFGDHPQGWGNANHIDRWKVSFSTIAEDLKKTDCRVINASRSTALDCFECMDLSEALKA